MSKLTCRNDIDGSGKNGERKVNVIIIVLRNSLTIHCSILSDQEFKQESHQNLCFSNGLNMCTF